MTNEENKANFIFRATELYGGTFDYSKIDYTNSKTPVKIFCNKHNLFFYQTPDSFLRQGSNCPECIKERREQKIAEKRDKRDIVSEFKQIHGDFYDYSRVDYRSALESNRGNVEILCPIHGSFFQNYNHHLSGSGCPKCSRRYTDFKGFLELARSLYGDQYSYDKTDYVDSFTKITVTCNVHNLDFEVLPLNFLRPGHFICPDCSTRVTNMESFLQRVRSLGLDRDFDFSESNYVTSKQPIVVKCCHCDEMLWTCPDKLLRWEFRCPCQRHKFILEDQIEKLLESGSFSFIRNKRFQKLNPRLSFDFYLPNLNTVIECQGLQHFEPVEWFGGERAYSRQKENDLLKSEFCKNNNLELYYYTKEKYRLKFQTLNGRELFSDILTINDKLNEKTK